MSNPAGSRHDAVTRNHDRQRIPVHGTPDRPRRAGMTRPPGQISVCDFPARRDITQRPVNLLLEWCAGREIEFRAAGPAKKRGDRRPSSRHAPGIQDGKSDAAKPLRAEFEYERSGSGPDRNPPDDHDRSRITPGTHPESSKPAAANGSSPASKDQHRTPRERLVP